MGLAVWMSCLRLRLGDLARIGQLGQHVFVLVEVA